MKYKRITAALLTWVLVLSVAITACDANTNTSNTADNNTGAANANPGANPNVNAEFTVVCSIFPQYDWVREVLGERYDVFNVSYLADSGVDSHSFAPSVAQIARVSSADLFIYTGGKSDGWAENISRDSNKLNLNLIDVLGDDVLIFGNFCSDDCNEDHDHEKAQEGEAADEHIWVSLRHTMTVVSAIGVALSELDPAHAGLYSSNADEYIAKLSVLDKQYQQAVDAANVTTLVFADRFPFRYLMEDYGLTYYAAFQGCSAETEASFSTIVSLANRINQLGLEVVMVTETSDKSIANTVINSTDAKNQRILVLDSMKMVLPNDVQNGVTYLSIMESNLEVLREALS